MSMVLLSVIERERERERGYGRLSDNLVSLQHCVPMICIEINSKISWCGVFAHVEFATSFLEKGPRPASVDEGLDMPQPFPSGY